MSDEKKRAMNTPMIHQEKSELKCTELNEKGDNLFDRQSKKTGQRRDISAYLSKKISSVSFFFAILVVMLHSYCVGKLSIENGFDEFVYNLQTVICQDLARCAIPTFFAISGFLFFAKVNTIIDVLQGMKRHFFSLAIPFCIVNISYTVLEAIRWIVLRGESVETFLTGCNSIAEFLIRSVFLFHYNVVGWYLFTLMLWSGLTPLLYFVLKMHISVQ